MQLTWLIPSLLFGAYLGATTGAWHLLAMSAGSWLVMLLTKRFKPQPIHPDDELTIENGRVFIGHRKLPRAQLFWRQAWVDFAFDQVNSMASSALQEQEIERLRANSFRARTPNSVFLGFDNQQAVEIDLARAGPHLFLVGATGSGKSELIKLICQSTLADPQQDTRLAFIDFKGGSTFHAFLESPRCLGLATNLSDSNQFLLSILLELQSREKLFSEHGVSNMFDYRALGYALPAIMVFVDEVNEFLKVAPGAQNFLESIAARGRSLGIHLVLAAQTTSGITRAIMVNLKLRIGIGQLDAIDAMQIGLAAQLGGTHIKARPGWQQAQLAGWQAKPTFFAFPVANGQITSWLNNQI